MEAAVTADDEDAEIDLDDEGVAVPLTSNPHVSFLIIDTSRSPSIALTNISICQIRVFFGQKNPITIEDLFNWTVKNGWNLFWDQGKKHYQEEMLFYELLSWVENEPPSQASAPTVGSSSRPVDVDTIE